MKPLTKYGRQIRIPGETMQNALSPRYDKFRNGVMLFLRTFHGHHVHPIHAIQTHAVRPSMQNSFVLYRFENIDFPQ